MMENYMSLDFIAILLQNQNVQNCPQTITPAVRIGVNFVQLYIGVK